MAEVLGIAASIIAIAQLAGKLTSVSYSYIECLKNATQDLRDLANELASLSSILATLQKNIDTDPGASATLQLLGDTDGPLKVCEKVLKELQQKLKPPRKGFAGLIKRAKWPLKKEETMQYVARVERHKSLFIFALTADTLSLSKKIEMYARFTNLGVEGLQNEAAAQNLWRQRDEVLQMEEKRKKVLKWLASQPHDEKHIEIKNKRQEGTGGWLSKTPEFQTWENGVGASKLLWGYGIPGAGKTFLSSIVIDHFEAQTNCAVAFIYFDYKDQDRQTVTPIISSLIKQLACQTSKLPPEIEALYDKEMKEDKKPTFGELYSALLATTNLLQRVFFVFDALDECNPDTQRRDLLPLFHRMAGDGNNIFMTSRPHPEDVQISLGGGLKIELSAHEQDIRSYIEEKINQHPRAKRLVRQGECKEKIISELVDCAKGMFLLVRFHIEYLCQQTTVNQILTELGKLKSASVERPLDPTYDRAMDNIRGQPRNCVELALKVLSWLVKAKRTLTLDEIQVAVSVQPDRYKLDQFDLPDKTTLLDVCASLVIIDDATNTIRLAHYTVQEYLVNSSAIPKDANFNVAMVCITYLSFDQFGEAGSRTSTLQSIPFLEYSVSHLRFHLKESDESLTLDMMLRFFDKPGNMSTYLQLSRSPGSPPTKHSPLHIASDIGHYMLVLWLLQRSTASELIASDSAGETALHRASARGHETVVRLLLENGADISAQSTYGYTALHKAASNGNEAVVRLLLENGADISTQSRNRYTALHLAASNRHETIVRFLLENGVDISAQSSNGDTALHKAALDGSEAIVRLLLENGADISAQSSNGDTALHKAASNGNEAVVRFLLENGSSISAQCNSGWTALHEAALDGRGAMVRLLLENGADISAQTSGGDTALHKAALNGNEAVVWLLLENGVDISAQNSGGETALHIATRRRHTIIAQLLLSRVADANSSVRAASENQTMVEDIVVDGTIREAHIVRQERSTVERDRESEGREAS